MSNDEGNPKSQRRRRNPRPGEDRFGIRSSSFIRHSTFGFRHCPEPPYVGSYKFMNDLKFALRQLLKNPGFTALFMLLTSGAATVVAEQATAKGANSQLPPEVRQQLEKQKAALRAIYL